MKGLGRGQFRLEPGCGAVTLCGRNYASAILSVKLILESEGQWEFRAKLSGMFEPIFWPQPVPCKRYLKRMRWSANFIAHLRTCRDCNAVIAYLNRESEISLYFYKHR